MTLWQSARTVCSYSHWRARERERERERCVYVWLSEGGLTMLQQGLLTHQSRSTHSDSAGTWDGTYWSYLDSRETCMMGIVLYGHCCISHQSWWCRISSSSCHLKWCSVETRRNWQPCSPPCLQQQGVVMGVVSTQPLTHVRSNVLHKLYSFRLLLPELDMPITASSDDELCSTEKAAQHRNTHS